MKKIDFKQSKYIAPLVVYAFALFLGYKVDEKVFAPEKEKVNEALVKSENLNGKLPAAQLKDGIGGKRDNMKKTFGNVRDLSAMGSLESDRDSLHKTENYESKYSEEEALAIAEKQKVEELEKKRKELEERLKAAEERGRKLGKSDEDLQDANLRRRQQEMEELERKLGLVRRAGRTDTPVDSAAMKDEKIKRKDVGDEEEENPKAIKALSDDDKGTLVVKKVTETSDFFNTLSENDAESRLIKAIVDEEVKATDGSRVRLRLLDDITIGDITLKKGNYLYATVSGLGSQRVKGQVKSVLVGDELLKVSLTIYDTDGQEGLYVPGNVLRETAQDVAGSAMSGGTSNLTEGNYGSSGFGQWATNAIQQATTRTANAVSKVVKKKKVRIKYGTQVYLVNGRNDKKGK